MSTETACAEAPQMPKPTKEHDWLQRLVGEWEVEVRMYMNPEQPLSVHGTETWARVGGFWVTGAAVSDTPEMPYANQISLGYDPAKGEYIGNWVDSMTSNLGVYHGGKVDDSGRVLTLYTGGFCPMTNKHLKFQEVHDFKSDHHRVFTSWIIQEDGSLTRIMELDARRK